MAGKTVSHYGVPEKPGEGAVGVVYSQRLRLTLVPGSCFVGRPGEAFQPPRPGSSGPQPERGFLCVSSAISALNTLAGLKRNLARTSA